MPVEIVENRIGEHRAASKRLAVESVIAGQAACERQMIADCPVGEGGGEGGLHMYETIDSVPEDQVEREWGAEGGVKVGDPSAGVDYAGYVVLGTSRQSPQDFVSPAFETGRRALLDRAQAGARAG